MHFELGTLNNIQTGRAQMKCLIVYEKSNTGWGAYAPDLPGLGAGKTLDDVKELIRKAVEFHLEGMRAHGDPARRPNTSRSESGRWG
jgi:predicted RNase H-like HicB family nuclease